MSRIRAKLLTEWRGGIDPPHPARNIHQPDEYLDELLKAVGLSDGVDEERLKTAWNQVCLLYTSPSPRDQRGSRMPSSA